MQVVHLPVLVLVTFTQNGLSLNTLNPLMAQ
jgi:hypothetical protein